MILLENNDKLGYYQVGEEKIHIKPRALIRATQTGHFPEILSTLDSDLKTLPLNFLLTLFDISFLLFFVLNPLAQREEQNLPDP